MVRGKDWKRRKGSRDEGGDGETGEEGREGRKGRCVVAQATRQAAPRQG